MQYLNGTELDSHDVAYVLQHCVTRRTYDVHRVFGAFRRDFAETRLQLPTDAEWLAKTTFLVDARGRIPRNQRVQFVSMARTEAA